MGRRSHWWALCAAALVLAGLASAGAGARSSEVPVVPSLEPEKTEALWRSLVRRPRHQRAQGECRPLRGVFYAATDWLRLATKLAATPSPCAEYYVSIPPIVGDKTNLRQGQAERIRALGRNFHALAEIHWTSWSRWVAENGTTWHAAGVEARRRMAQAGFEITAGDTWAVNEFPSTVRSGAGDARANARELVRGLYEGDGTRTARGVVFIVGLGQPTTNVSVYQTNLQNWLADTAFWTDMSTFVSDWSQEVYSDFRRYAVPGAPITLRRDYLNDYLQHALVVARAGPPTIELARGYLQTAFSPAANAAWQYESGYGWTLIPVDQMRAFVSAQVYALRAFSVAAGLSQDRWGFAWQPRNGSGLSAGDFAAQTGSILDRLGAAIRDSGPSDPNDPGGGACGPPGENVFCGGDLTGAVFTESWKALRAWLGSILAFATPPQTLTAGQPSAPLTLNLQTSTGSPLATTTPIIVTLTSSSQDGRFSLSPSGPWASQISTTIPAGGTATPPFHYLDTRAGPPQVKATAVGVTTATQVETVAPGPLSRLRVDPGSAVIGPRGSRRFAVTGEDAFGNLLTASATWTVTPAGLAIVRPTTGSSTTVRAEGRGGNGLVVARAGAVSASASLKVNPGPIRVSSIRYSARPTVVRVTASLAEVGGGAARSVRTSVVVRRNGRPVFSASKRTDATGRTTYLVPRSSGCYRTTVTSATAPGYRWNGKTPANRFCTTG
jgi:type IV pilus biogenesis protein CpaD/CtpE